jgi:predicted O-methyltransferase YrrM
MRSVAHWTPRYIAARFREIVDHYWRPNDPWLTRESIGILERLLKPTDTALEFGSGRSTLWIAPRVSRLTSVEHDHHWHAIVSKRAQRDRLSNITLLLKPKDVDDNEGSASAYVRVLDSIADDSLDFVLVDGVYRNYCAIASVPKLKSGGVMAIDNANWFLPSRSHSPGSRSPEQGPADPVWQKFADLSRGWRMILTSSGVTDTLILIKSY